MLGGKLHGIDDAQDLVEVAPGGHGVDQDELDQLVRPDDEDVAHGGVVRGGPAFGRAFGVRRQHAVELGDLEVGVGDHGKVGRRPLRFANVRRPAGVIVHRVDGKADHLDPALVELGLQPGHGAQFGGADRREILGMREQHRPGIANPIVKMDSSLGGLGLEIRGDVVER